MTWSDFPEDLFEVLVTKLTPCHFKSLHLVNRRFNALVKLHVTRISPKTLQYLFKPNRFPNVTSLDLSRCWDQIHDHSLQTFSKCYAHCKGTKLKKLSLAKCHGVTNTGTAALSLYLTQLEELNLEGCRSPVPASYVGYTGVNGETIGGLKQLKKLQLRWNPVSDASFCAITHLKHLTHLDLGECHGMTETGIAMVRCFQQMEVLNLERTMINRSGIHALAELPYLTSLSVRNCSEIDDLCVIDLTRLHQLTFLDMGKLNEITDDGMRHLIKLTKLQSLDLAYSTRLTGTWVEGSGTEGEGWSLRKLKLKDCYNWVTDGVLQRIAAKMPHLKELVLQNCAQVGQNGLAALHRCPLTSLDLSLCSGVTDPEMKLLSSMKRLVHLDLEFCAQMTDDGLQTLQKFVFLESLILSCCRHITDIGLRALQPLSVRLRRLEIAACHGIRTDVLFYISNWFHQLEVLNISWLPVKDIQFRSLRNLKFLSRVNINGCHELTPALLKEFGSWMSVIDGHSQV